MAQPPSTNAALQQLLREVRACRICTAHLPLPPRPVLQAGAVPRGWQHLCGVDERGVARS